MITQKESLQRYFDNFINQKDDWWFFVGLAEYVNYLNSNQLFSLALEKIEKSKQNTLAPVEILEKQVVLECMQAMDKLKDIIAEKKWEYEELINLLKEFVAYSDGKIQSTAPLSQNLFFNINDIIVLLVNKGHYKQVEDFYENFDQDPTKIRRCTFSPSLRDLDRAKELHKHKSNTQVWGSFEQLQLCRMIIMEGKEQYNQMAQEEIFPIQALSLSMLLGDMRSLEEGTARDKYSIFKKDKFVFHATRVHNFVLSQEILIKGENSFKPLEYRDGFLYIDGVDVEISKDADSNQHYILSTFNNVFTSPKGNDEVWVNVYKTEYDKDKWRKLYRAVEEINRKIDKKIHKTDFFISTSKQIRVNPKYLR